MLPHDTLPPDESRRSRYCARQNSPAHVALAIGATVVLAGFIAMRAWSLGSLATQSDSVVCGDYCRAQGFSCSGIPPRDSGNRTRSYHQA